MSLKRISFLVLVMTLSLFNINLDAKAIGETHAAAITSVDAAGTTVSSSGDFNVHLTLKGSNLTEVQRVRVTYDGSYSTISSPSFTEASASEIVIDTPLTKTFVQNKSGDVKVGAMVTTDGTTYGSEIPAYSSVLLNQSVLTTDGLVSKATGTPTEQVELSVKAPNSAVTSVDATGSSVDPSTGNFNLHVTVTGENLDNVQRVRLFYGDSYSTITNTNFFSQDETRIVFNAMVSRSFVLGKGGEVSPAIAFSDDSTIYSTRQDIFSSSNINDVKTVGDHISTMTAGPSSKLTLSVAKVEDPSSTITSIDAAGSSVNPTTGDFDIHVTVSGTNLDKVQRARLFYNGAYSTIVNTNFFSQDATRIVFNATASRSFVLGKGGEVKTQVAFSDDGANYTTPQDLFSSASINDEKTVGDYISTMTGYTTTPLTLTVEKVEIPASVITSVDGAGSSVNPTTGDFNIHVTVTGSNLDQVQRARVYYNGAYSTISSTNFVSQDATKIVFNTTALRSFVLNKGGEVKTQVAFSDDASNYTTPQNLYSSSAINDEKIVGDYVSTMTGSTASPLTLTVEDAAAPESVITSVDGAGSSVNPTTGNFDLHVTVRGTDLDQVQRARIYYNNDSYSTIGSSSFFSQSATEIVFNATATRDFVLNEGGLVTTTIAFSDDSTTYTTPQNLYSSASINDEKSVDAYISKLTGNTTTPLTLEVTGKPAEVTSIDGDASYVVSKEYPSGAFVINIVGNYLTNIETVDLQIVDAKDDTVVDTINLNSADYDLTNDTNLVIDLFVIGDELEATDYLGKTVYLNVSIDSGAYQTLTSTSDIDDLKYNSIYKGHVFADTSDDSVVYYNASGVTEDWILTTDGFDVQLRDVATNTYKDVDLGVPGPGDEGAREGLAWDDVAYRMFYTSNVRYDSFLGNDWQDIYVMSKPSINYDTNELQFGQKYYAYEDLSLLNPLNDDNGSNLGATYNQARGSYDMIYRGKTVVGLTKASDYYAAVPLNGAEYDKNNRTDLPKAMEAYSDDRHHDIAIAEVGANQYTYYADDKEVIVSDGIFNFKYQYGPADFGLSSIAGLATRDDKIYAVDANGTIVGNYLNADGSIGETFVVDPSPTGSAVKDAA